MKISSLLQVDSPPVFKLVLFEFVIFISRDTIGNKEREEEVYMNELQVERTGGGVESVRGGERRMALGRERG